MAANLNEAITRLEKVTERLLRFESSLGPVTVSTPAAAPTTSSSNKTAPNKTVVEPINGPPAAAATENAVGSSSELSAYDQLLAEHLQPFMVHATAIGGEVLDASKLVEKAFKEQRTVLLVASKAKQPDVSQLQSVLHPVADPMMAASGLADNRRSACFQQLKVVAESLQGLSWLAYTGPTCGMHLPAQHISESWNAAEFFANKLLRDNRGVNDTQVAWVTALKGLFSALQDFVRLNCPTGLKWNANGCTSIAAALAAAGTAAAAPPAAAAVGSSAKPPPVAPPPPPPGLLLQPRPGQSGSSSGGGQAAAAAKGSSGMHDVLKALQQGSAVTAGLRKVTDDMKTKNRADRSGQVTTPASSAAAAASKQPAAAAVAAAAKPPRLELEQERKWVVEWQTNQQGLVVNVANPKQTVCIYNCTGSTVQVKGKCNAISIDNCKKTGIVFEDVIASCELVNCSSVQVQCTGALPTLSIEKCDGVQAYIPAALGANPDFQIVTAKSSEVNVIVIAANPEAEDATEHAVPEQFISTFVNGKLVTTAASHGGG